MKIFLLREEENMNRGEKGGLLQFFIKEERTNIFIIIESGKDD